MLVNVETDELDEIGHVRVELGQNDADVLHRGPGLRGEVTRIADVTRGVEIDLAAEEDHLAAPHPVLMRHVYGPVPVSIGPGIASCSH